MGLENQGGKPTGLIGKLVGKLMNKFHTAIYINYFKEFPLSNNSIILDIGCGGGKFIDFLACSNSTYKLYGLDHSAVMIELSHKINKEAINQKRVELIKGSVVQIPLNDSSINLVTAFETVQFWPDIQKAFKEVARVLKKGGEFLIINRYPPENSKWWQMAKIKSDNEYILQLEKAEFDKITTDIKSKKGWIIVKGITRSE